MALSATLAPSSEHMDHPALWELSVRIRNDGEQPVRFSTATMLGSVAFEVEDARGRRVPLGPPPVPPSDLAADFVTLAPGESLTLEFHGDEVLPDAPAPGSYRLRFAGTAPPLDDAWSGRVESPWVQFTAGG